MEKKYRWLTRKEADALMEAGAPVEWRYNLDRYAVRPTEDKMQEWKLWADCLRLFPSADGYDDQFRIEVE